ncbi:MAG: hypothetical protein AAB724_01400 [Patescibacteria group bacterium]
MYLEEKLGRYLMQVVQDLLQEIEQAMAEGIPVASGELERLQEKLSGLRPSE